uniref:Choline transporter-like protein n=1 Tax=Esox lucius TaxID=8010 RepID=A0A3P8ZLJ9_ESOLU
MSKCHFCLSRSCTDVICCLLFLTAIAGYMVVGVLAWLFGDPRHIFFPRNSNGRFCGSGTNRELPSMIYVDILKCATTTNVMAAALEGQQCPTTQLCVPDCPSQFWMLPPDAYEPGAEPKDFFQQKYCDPSLSLATTTWVHRPLSTVKHLRVERCAGCGYPDAKHVVKGLVVAMLVSVVFLLLLRYVPVVLVWLLVAGVLVVGGYGKSGVEPWWFGDMLCTCKLWTTNLFLLVQQVGLSPMFFLSLYGVLSCMKCGVVSVFRAVGKLTSTLVYPMWTFVLVVVCVAYCVMTSLHLVTSGAPLYRVVSLSTSVAECGGIDGSEACQPQTFDASAYPGCPSVRCIFFKYSDTGVFQQNLAYLHVYNVLAFLWCVNFVIALGQCTLAGAFASYYWAFSKPAEIPPFALTRSFICSLRYHVGSLAFGAVALSCFQLLRLLLEYLDHKTQGSQGYVGRFLATCLRCCFWCLDYFLKYLNRNAYVMIAIYGENFGVSAKNAYSLLMRNIERVVLLDRMTEVFFFFAKLLIVGAVGVLAFFFFTGQIPLTSDTLQAKTLNYHWMPVLTVTVGAYFISQAFFSVYSMCADTLFICFLEDLERNDGTVQKPYYMSRNLMKILSKPQTFP